jgi:acetolactate synthase-1/2/3 large subunit
MSALFELAAALGALVVSSPAGKRWVGHHEPRYRGVLGFSGHEAAQRAAARADLILTFGATFDELSTNTWTVFPDVPLYAIDEHDRFAYRVPQARAVVGGAADVLSELSRRVPGDPAMTPAPPSRIRLRDPEAGAGPVHPTTLMRWLSEALPDDVVVHVDAGNSFSWSTRDLLRPRPDTYRVAMGLSTMCWAISAVIGACVGRRRRALCVTGDGSMLMSSLELTVAVEQQLPVTYVVLNDSGLGMVRHGQRLGGAESIAHEITPVRFDELARACGARGRRVESCAELDSIERDWLRSDAGGPCLIDVCIDREAVPPMADRVCGLAAGAAR